MKPLAVEVAEMAVEHIAAVARWGRDGDGPGVVAVVRPGNQRQQHRDDRSASSVGRCGKDAVAVTHVSERDPPERRRCVVPNGEAKSSLGIPGRENRQLRPRIKAEAYL